MEIEGEQRRRWMGSKSGARTVHQVSLVPLAVELRASSVHRPPLHLGRRQQRLAQRRHRHPPQTAVRRRDWLYVDANVLNIRRKRPAWRQGNGTARRKRNSCGSRVVGIVSSSSPIHHSRTSQRGLVRAPHVVVRRELHDDALLSENPSGGVRVQRDVHRLDVGLEPRGWGVEDAILEIDLDGARAIVHNLCGAVCEVLRRRPRFSAWGSEESLLARRTPQQACW